MNRNLTPIILISIPLFLYLYQKYALRQLITAIQEAQLWKTDG